MKFLTVFLMFISVFGFSNVNDIGRLGLVDVVGGNYRIAGPPNYIDFKVIVNNGKIEVVSDSDDYEVIAISMAWSDDDDSYSSLTVNLEGNSNNTYRDQLVVEFRVNRGGIEYLFYGESESLILDMGLKLFKNSSQFYSSAWEELKVIGQ